MTHQVELSYGKREFTVAVEFNERRYLSITVHPDLRITAKAPSGCGKEMLRRRLEKKVSWIAAQIDFFEQFFPRPVERQFVSGETHYYLGRQYRLRMKQGKTARVRLIGRFFEVELPEPGERAKAKKLMQAWYATHARQLFEKRLDSYISAFRKLGAQEPQIRYRRMAKRWGSCSASQIITINTELAKAPYDCIDYVIIHELCHLIFPKHDNNFFRLLGRFIPDWEIRKKRLEKVNI